MVVAKDALEELTDIEDEAVVDTLEVRLFAFLGAMLKPVLPDS